MEDKAMLQEIENAVGEAIQEAPSDLQKLIESAAALRVLKDDKTTSLKQTSSELERVSNEILKTLDLMELESVKGHGFLFFKENKTSVTTPKSPEEKKALFEYLESKGMLLEMASVNSQTLNSLYKSLAEEALENGNLEFKLPGVKEPATYTKLKMRKG